VRGKIAARRLLRRSYRLSWLYGSWRFWRMQNHKRQPLLVYQMGKVGSRSVYQALLPLRQSHSLYHVHTLNETQLNSAAKAYRQTFGVRHVVPDHLMASRHLLRDLAAGQPHGRWKVVSLVREPIARNISSFFQDLELQHPDFSFAEKATLRTEQLVDELVELFLDGHDHTEPLEWCDTELAEILGVDVYATPFPHERGWELYQSPRAEVLLVRLEDLATVMPSAFSFFLDGFRPTVPVVNAAADKSYRELYGTFQKTLRLPESYLRLMYESRYAQHFYTTVERATFYRSWSTHSQQPEPTA
jgi:hypothetical protein